jgi:bacillithiol synthase
MHQEKVSLPETRSFSSFFLEYIQGSKSLTPFYNRFPKLDSFKGQLEEKTSSFSEDHRAVLVEELKNQYADFNPPEPVVKNLIALRSAKTFTVTTGHQLNIFTGPLYVIYKIVTVINTCRQLRKVYPDYQFVPVYWMASEDHDFEEISYFHLFGQEHRWKTTQQGAVGRINPKELKTLLPTIPGDIQLFEEAYLKQSTLSQSVRFYMNALFGEYGLVVLDADCKPLKRLLKKVIHDDLFDGVAKIAVDRCNVALELQGIKPPVHARDINFFYLDGNIRSRLERHETGFRVVDNPLHFTRSEMEALIDEHPERFSPNVILRPLYQEIVLPNLAYAGGPAEICYWLQLKELFGHYPIPFPILLPRNFALVMNAPTRRKFEKTGLSVKDLFEDKNYLFNHWTLQNTPHHLTVTESMEAMRVILDNLKIQASKVDSTLIPLVGAEEKKIFNQLEKIESRFLRAEKRRLSDKLRQVEALKDSLFPDGNLQERHDNFLAFYQSDKDFIKKLVNLLDPLDFRFNILQYDE